MFDGRWRHAVDRTTKPVGRALVRAHINADVLTVFGLAMSALTAVVVGSGHLVIAIGMLFATGLPDLFDGPVAKASGTASVRGAFFDSVADRISDAFMYGGVAWYLAVRHHGTMVVLPFAIVAMTSLVSYERAKAELLGLSAGGGGLMERAERFILLGVCFLAGSVTAAAFVPALWVFFGLITLTAVGRFVRTWQEAEGPVRPDPRVWPMRVRTARVARWRDLRADVRWRAWRDATAQRSAEHEGREGTWVRAAFGRRAGEPLNRWLVRRDGAGFGAGASAGAGRSSERRLRTWRERRAAVLEARTRLHERVGGHSSRPGSDRD